MNTWTVMGLLMGTTMVLFGLALALGINLPANLTTISGLCGLFLMGMTLGAYFKTALQRLAVASIGAPLALVAMVSLSAVPLASQPTLALAQISTAVERGNDGHFHATATINGTGVVEMLVDTGASVILLSHAHAKNIGINVDVLDYSVPVITASGRSHVATIVLDNVDVGGVTLYNVEAAVALEGLLDSSLLGMTYLGALKEVVLRGDQMILRN